MKSSKVLLGVLIGCAAGAVLGILFAPDKGTATRDKISKKGKKYADDIKHKSNEFADSVSEKFQHVKDEGARIADSWKQKAKDVETDLKRKV